MMTEADALRVLNVERGATAAQIRQAYLDLVKVWHPDRFEHDARLRERAVRTLQEINDAYALLQQRSASPGPGHASTPPSPDAPPASGSPPHADASSRPGPVSTASPERAWTSQRNLLAAAAAVVVGILLGVWLVRDRDRDSGQLAVADGAAAPVSAAPEPTPGQAARPADAAPPAQAPERSRRPRSDDARNDVVGPESGTELRNSGTAGRGALTITNGATSDALVLLTADGGHHRALYIRRGERITLLDLVPADYRVRAALGHQWTGDAFAVVTTWIERRQPTRVRDDRNRSEQLVLAATGGAFQVAEPFSLP